ncbi:MAG TPA: MarR family transcriptional regulator [Actinomycetes bacterium]|nr:MarR family transcriptional regulator [Actinomycetes bacterium]
MSEPRWLDADQQQVWRTWLTAQLLLAEVFEHDLKATSGLSMAEYEVLVRLSEAPGRRLRMSELAARTLASRSRLSHQVARMEEEGLVRREECVTDKRGWWAVLTDHGWEVLVAAAPHHVESVRRHLVDVFDEGEFDELGHLLDKVVERLQPDGSRRI